MAISPPLLLILTAATLTLLVLSPQCHAGNILYSGVSMLETGRSLTWNSYVLTMQTDCNLVLYAYGNPVWATNTAGLGSGCHLAMQQDGNLVIYNSNLNSVWASNTGTGCGNYVLIVQKDRNVVVYGTSNYALWAANTIKFIGPADLNTSAVKPQPDSTAANNVLYSGDQVGSTLPAGSSLTWGRYSLKMKPNCNLVLYDSSTAIWATNTTGKSSECYLKLESNGGLVVYGKETEVVWRSGSSGVDGFYVLVLQKDRNLVIYGSARWASGTYAGFAGVSAAVAEKQIRGAANQKLNATLTLCEKGSK